MLNDKIKKLKLKKDKKKLESTGLTRQISGLSHETKIIS
jgi:cell division protein FtsL